MSTTNPNDLLNNMAIREYMATHIMAGLPQMHFGSLPEEIARRDRVNAADAAWAVGRADALIEALNKKEDSK